MAGDMVGVVLDVTLGKGKLTPKNHSIRKKSHCQKYVKQIAVIFD